MEYKLEPGTLVKRGKDWEWNDQDGGEGGIGTVVCPTEQSIYEGGIVVQWYRVKWEHGRADSYRYCNAVQDLKVFNPNSKETNKKESKKNKKEPINRMSREDFISNIKDLV